MVINNIFEDTGIVTYTVTASSGEAEANTIDQYTYQKINAKGDPPYTVSFDINSGSVNVSVDGVTSDDAVTVYMDAVITSDAGGTHAVISSSDSTD